MRNASRNISSRFGEPTFLVVDDAEHVVDVGVGRLLPQHLGEAVDGLLVLTGQVVRAPPLDELAQPARIRVSHEWRRARAIPTTTWGRALGSARNAE